MAACGSDGREAGPAEYCERVAAYAKDTRDVDTTSPESIIDGFAQAAERARAVADVAPDEVRAAHERLADAAEALVAALQASDPQTMAEFETIGNEISEELVDEFGDLEAETQQVKVFAEDECGVTFPEPG